MKVSDLMLRLQPLRLSEIARGQVELSGPASLDFFPVVDDSLQYCGIIRKETLSSIQTGNLDTTACAAPLLDASIPTVFSDSDIDTFPDSIHQAVVLDKNRQVIGVLPAARLINALRKSIHEFENRFSAVIDSALNGILAVDSAGLIIIANRVVGEIMGVPQDQLIGRQVAELIPHTLMPVILESRKPLLGQKIVLANTMVMGVGGGAI